MHNLHGKFEPIDGDHRTRAFMTNVYVSYPLAAFRPYLGVGVGVAKHELSLTAIGNKPVWYGIPLTLNDTVVARQIMLGVGYRLSERLEAHLGYRRFTTVHPRYLLLGAKTTPPTTSKPECAGASEGTTQYPYHHRRPASAGLLPSPHKESIMPTQDQGKPQREPPAANLDELYRRIDDAHSEALACRLLLTQMLRLMRSTDSALVDRCLTLNVYPEERLPSPLEARAKRILDDLAHLVRS